MRDSDKLLFNSIMRQCSGREIKDVLPILYGTIFAILDASEAPLKETLQKVQVSHEGLIKHLSMPKEKGGV